MSTGDNVQAVRPRRSHKRWKHYLYLLPGVLLFGCFVLAPLLMTVYWSAYRWNGVGEAAWVGAENYLRILSDRSVQVAFGNAAQLLFFYCVLPLSIGLFLAVVASRSVFTGLGTVRAMIFLPQVVAVVVVAQVWALIFEPNSGTINGLLRAVGLDELARPWLGDFDFALPSVGVVATWTQYGLCMLLLLAGIQRIPQELFDAAKMDGAGFWRELSTVTFPSIRMEIAVAAVLTLITGLRNFDLVFNMTRGGPGDSTLVPALEVYRRAFVLGDVGGASALAVIITVAILALTLIVSRLFERREA
ncbi:carbohydrate ABC transporter permease [Microcella humidisoli]|uniref:Sugar ABC transporter permease n=1 Tax=Microcella humidisoli TaxID=2963406 RepID=A0ABY5FZG4_9MICO|nr:sugar ABC transporter permease [Microcella humidisoli]UTT63689.1 sugar ABC transporter permease [Microcella humidisoli]